MPVPKQAQDTNGQLLDDEEVVFAEVCYICKVTKTLEEEEAMLVCDECDYEIAHHQCLNLPYIPEDEWFCHSCTKERKERQREEKIQRKRIMKLSPFKKLQ